MDRILKCFEGLALGVCGLLMFVITLRYFQDYHLVKYLGYSLGIFATLSGWRRTVEGLTP